LLKSIGGSRSDDFNNVLVNQAIQTLWTKHADKEGLDEQYQAVLVGLMGIGPQDELEGMLAAQLVATHAATMECFRRAMLNEQSFEGRKENLTQANKLSRTYTTLLEALNRYRGKRTCQSPAMPNGRCRMHGGRSPGAPKGERNGNYKRGRFTSEAIARRRELSGWVKLMRKIAEDVD
jgi:hypothetical protein